MSSGRARHSALAAIVVLAAAAACTRQSAPVTTRLVDVFRPEQVTARAAAPASTPARMEWTFRDAAAGPPHAAAGAPHGAGRAWESGPGIAGLEIKDGRLQGRTTSTVPIVHLSQPPPADASDVLGDIEVRLRASAGVNLNVAVSGQEKVDLEELAKQTTPVIWTFYTPIIAGDEMRTYVLHNARGIPLGRARHVMVRPTDAAGAQFAIESVRLVSRRERLAAFASGVAWQGLSEIYRESIVSRAPETVRIPVSLPERPWLDLAVGTVEEVPVGFRVAIADGDKETTVLERTVTTPHRWENVPVNLQKYAGRRVTLALSLIGERPGLVGLWGAPVVRSLGAMPRPAAAAKTTGDPPQGIVLVWVDTLRRDHLDAYGYGRPTAPAVRQMAAEGTLFRDEVVQATWTKVSTPSVLTSLYPTSHTVADFSDRLPSAAVTLADVYRQAGYATLSMSSGIFTGRFTNLHKGFEEVQENGSLKGELRTSKTARVFVDRLLPWLAAHREVPFFVFLHVQDPHDPYRPYAPYDTLWADAAGAEEHERQLREVRKVIVDPTMRAFIMPTREDLVKAGFDPDAYVDYERGWYDGAIRGMDVEIARLLEGLRNLGLDRRTLVAYTADHGEEFLEHGKMFHGHTTYGELANVPLVFWRPGSVPGGAVIDQTVQSIDIMPTLLEMSGLPVPKAAQGHSLVPLMTAAPGGTAHAAPAAWPAITEKQATRETGGPPPRDTASVAIVLDGWKLVHNTKAPPGHPEFELFDHGKDPLDKTDVAAAHPDVVQRLARELDAWRRMAEGARLPPDSKSREGLGREELERLRALGYIQ